jgi:hypothetical protein
MVVFQYCFRVAQQMCFVTVAGGLVGAAIHFVNRACAALAAIHVWLFSHSLPRGGRLLYDLLFTYSRKKARSRAMLFIQLLLQFSKVKLDYLEAQLRPVEHLDRRPPWMAEGRTMQEQLSRSRDWVRIIGRVIDQIEGFASASI